LATILITFSRAAALPTDVPPNFITISTISLPLHHKNNGYPLSQITVIYTTPTPQNRKIGCRYAVDIVEDAWGDEQVTFTGTLNDEPLSAVPGYIVRREAR
jgi:hypothetical protein